VLHSRLGVVADIEEGLERNICKLNHSFFILFICKEFFKELGYEKNFKYFDKNGYF
jgi:hypothetical protein